VLMTLNTAKITPFVAQAADFLDVRTR
jgi:hypothetical protein